MHLKGPLSAECKFRTGFDLALYPLSPLLCSVIKFHLKFIVMKDWFVMGGSLFMSILTILLVIIVAISVYFAAAIASGKASEKENFKQQLRYIKSLGLFTMITGILGQLIGLFSAFTAIEAAGDVSPAMLAGGLKISLITTLTGIVIYLISILIWFLLDMYYQKKLTS